MGQGHVLLLHKVHSLLLKFLRRLGALQAAMARSRPGKQGGLRAASAALPQQQAAQLPPSAPLLMMRQQGAVCSPLPGPCPQGTPAGALSLHLLGKLSHQPCTDQPSRSQCTCPHHVQVAWRRQLNSMHGSASHLLCLRGQHALPGIILHSQGGADAVTEPGEPGVRPSRAFAPSSLFPHASPPLRGCLLRLQGLVPQRRSIPDG